MLERVGVFNCTPPPTPQKKEEKKEGILMENNAVYTL